MKEERVHSKLAQIAHVCTRFDPSVHTPGTILRGRTGGCRDEKLFERNANDPACHHAHTTRRTYRQVDYAAANKRSSIGYSAAN